MPHISIQLQLIAPEMTLDELIARILEKTRGAKIAAEDWYAQRRIREEKSLQKIAEARGSPLPHAEKILESIDRAAHECGPAKTIVIPMPNGSTLQGRVSTQFILLHSKNIVDQVVAENLLAILKPLATIEDFHVSDIPSPQSVFDIT